MQIKEKTGHIVVAVLTIMLTAMEAVANATNTRGQSLLASAEKHFKNDLWPAEIEMFQNRGTVDCTPSSSNNINMFTDGTNDVDLCHANSWSKNRYIRADRLSWLCRDADALRLVNDDGIEITGAVVISEEGKTNTVNFERAHFPVCMMGCDIKAALRLNNAHLPCLYLTGSHVISIDAYQVTVDHDVALMSGFTSDGQVAFYVSHIGGDFDCTGGHFCNSDTNSFALEVFGTEIAGYVYLKGGFESDGEVTFWNSRVDNGFEWSDVQHPDKAILDLTLLKVESFQDDEKSWPKINNLRLEGFTYEEIIDTNGLIAPSRRMAWLGLQPTNAFHPQPYQQFASVLRTLGYEDDATIVMIDKNKDYAARLHWSDFRQWPQCFWYKLFGNFIGYGYKTWRAFVLSLIIIISGAFIFGFGRRRNLILPSTDKTYSLDSDLLNVQKSYPDFSAFIYSLEMFVPLVKLGIDDYWRPNCSRNTQIRIGLKTFTFTGRGLRWYLWCHILAGWVLTTLWVGGLTGLIKT